MDLHAIRQALAELLSTIPDLRAYAYTPSSPRPAPGGLAIVDEADDDQMVVYHQASGSAAAGLVTVALKVIVIVAAVDIAGAQRLLDAYRSLGTPQSIPDTLESLPTLHGAAHSVMVRGAGPTVNYDMATDGQRYWSVEFAIEVFA